MSQKISHSLNNLISYLKNPKLYSVSDETGRFLPPKVEVDSLLISWGLLSGHYQNDGTIRTTNWGRFHQLFASLFMWYLLFREFFCIFVDEKSIWIHYIGDISIIFVQMMPRIFFQVLVLILNVKPAFMTTYFLFNQNLDNLSWLRPMQLCKGKLNPSELNLTILMADKFWLRVYITTFLAKFTNFLLITTWIPVYLWMGWYYWPHDFYIPYGFYTTISLCISLHYLALHLCGVLFIFNQICYYFILRFDECNKHLKSYANHNSNTIKLDLIKIIGQHNQICKDITNFNNFWRTYLLIDVMTGSSLLAFMFFISFFTNVLLWIRGLFIISSIFIIITFYGSYITVSQISSKAHKSYALLNSIFIKSSESPLNLKLHLRDYISRLGGPVIGFYFWDLSPINYNRIFNAFLALSSYFLLFLEISLQIK